MRIDLIFSGVLGVTLGWFGIPWIFFRVKRKGGIKGTPNENKSIEGDDHKK